MELAGKKCLVIGMGRSGLAVAKRLYALGAEVFISDQKDREQLGTQLQQLSGINVRVLTGQDYNHLPDGIELVVISPGVPLSIPVVQKSYSLGIPVISEIELAYQLTEASIIAITGTNGKTTTTRLAGQIFVDAHYRVLVGGNIGNPLIDEVIKATSDHIIVAEVSSFQLETIDQFMPHVSAILNLTEDHIDRHGNFLNYIKAKARIFENQKSNNFVILNGDDPQVAALGPKVRHARVVLFSQSISLQEGVWVQGGEIVVKLSPEESVRTICSTKDIAIKGKHNLENALAATTIGLLYGIKPESIAYTLKNFQGVEHRLEPVLEVKGVTYINDSKGTNPDSTLKALAAYEQPLILIAGGKDKGTDFSILAEAIVAKVKHLIVIGETANIIEAAVRKVNFHNIHPADSMEDAVRKSANLASIGDVVMLSPACASLDMYSNFEERGQVFKTAVRSLRRD